MFGALVSYASRRDSRKVTKVIMAGKEDVAGGAEVCARLQVRREVRSMITVIRDSAHNTILPLTLNSLPPL